MQLVIRAFWEAKEGSTESQWEDGFAYDEAAGRMAVADGASAAAGAQRWARTLCEGFIGDPFRVENRESFEGWLGRRRQEWDESGDEPESDGAQWWKAEVERRGSWATMLVASVVESQPGEWRVHLGAVGDSVAMVVRAGSLRQAIPDLVPGSFGSHPELVGTTAASAPRTIDAYLNDTVSLEAGDLILLCTDALADFVLGEAETVPDIWGILGGLDAAGFAELVAAARAAGLLVNDDVTLLRCKIRTRREDDSGTV